MTLLLLALVPVDARSQQDEDIVFEDDDFFIFDEEEDEGPLIADPLETFNRSMFSLNDSLYRGVLKPVAVAYRKVPRPVRISVANVFDNLGTPISAFNALLQLDAPNTGTEIGRFLINSTIGILGLFDPATDMGLARDNEDLGQTFGAYGIGYGFYLVIPLVGPTSFRDFVGRIGNTALDPFLSNLEDGEAVAVTLIDAETEISLDADTYEAFYEDALDPYIFFRSSYAQNRDGQVED